MKEYPFGKSEKEIDKEVEEYGIIKHPKSLVEKIIYTLSGKREKDRTLCGFIWLFKNGYID